MAPADTNFGVALVVGGCGFQGHNLVGAILQAEPQCEVYALDIDTTRPTRRHASATYLTVDISDPFAVNAAFADMKPPPRVIFHTACPPSMSQDDELHWRVNVQGTQNILAAADSLTTVRAFVLSSTSSVGYDGVKELKMVKELPILDASKQSRGYSRSKGIAEHEVITANRKNSSGMLTCAVRPCTTFGPDDPHFFENILKVVKNKQVKYRFGNGDNLFDFIFVDNVSQALTLAASALLSAHGKAPLPAAERVEAETFNVTNDEHIPFWDLTIKTSNLWGHAISHDEIITIPKFVGVLMGFLAEWMTWIFTLGRSQPGLSVAAVQYMYLEHTMNMDKANARLRYRPRVTLQEGLERTVAWYQNKDREI